MTKTEAAKFLGRLGGKAGKGKSKSRHVTSQQARKAVMVRWDRYHTQQKENMK